MAGVNKIDFNLIQGYDPQAIASSTWSVFLKSMMHHFKLLGVIGLLELNARSIAVNKSGIDR